MAPTVGAGPMTMARSMNESPPRSMSFTAFDVPDFTQARALLAADGIGSAVQPDVFLSLDWFEHLAADGFADPVQPWLLAFGAPGESARCLLPLQSTPHGLRSLANYYSSLYGPVGAEPEAAEAWDAMACALQRAPGSAVLQLQPLAQDAVWVQSLAAALVRCGYWVDFFECFGNWYLPVGQRRFADYFAALPSPLRHSIERGRRRLRRTDGYQLAIHTEFGPALEPAIADFEAVYRQSWKQAEPCPQFMPGLMRLAAQRGWLRLGLLHVQGRPVAAQVWLVVHGKASIYKLAYVEGFQKLSPGSVLTAALMAHAMDIDRVHEIDYLTGDDAYKRDWMSQRRLRIGLVAFQARRVPGLMAAARHFAGRTWRRLQVRRRL